MPTIIEAHGFEAVAAALRELAARHAAGNLGLNEEGRRYARQQFDRERIIADLDARFSALLTER